VIRQLHKPKIVLVGGGKHCKVVISVLKSLNTYDIVGISDVKEKLSTSILEVEISFVDDQLKQLFESGTEYAFVSKGMTRASTLRRTLFEKLETIGFSFPRIVSQYAIVDPTAKIGPGTLIMPGSIIGPDASIGKNCILNTGCVVEHDCVIEDHAHIGISATLAGSVRIGECSLVGAGATVIQNLTIGEHVTVGAGSIVIRDVLDGLTIAGNPAKTITHSTRGSS